MPTPTIQRLMKRPFNKQKYILNQIKGSVFATSPYRLNQKATSPYTLSFSDGSPNFIVPFSNGYIDTLAAENYIARNRVVNPTLIIDSNLNNQADNWIVADGGVTTVTYAIDGGQKVTITNANLSNVSVTLTQQVDGFLAGETVQFEVEYKTEGAINARMGYNSGNTGINSPVGKSSIGVWTKEIFIGIIKPGDTYTKMYLGVRATSVGASGSVWFRNALIKKIPAVAINDSMTIDSDADGVTDGWTLNNYLMTGSNDVSTNGQHFNITGTTVQYAGKTVLKTATGFSANEKFSMRIDYKFTRLTGDMRFQYSFVALDGSNNILGTQQYPLVANTSTNGYVTFISSEYTLPANTASVRVSIGMIGYTIGGGDTGEVWFKNAKVYRSNVSAYVQQATDQSGNNNHLIQNTAANQPRIMNNGIWDVDSSGKINMVFNGTSSQLTSGTVSISNLCTTSVVWENNANTACRTFGFGDDAFGTNLFLGAGYTGTITSSGQRLPENQPVSKTEIPSKMILTTTRNATNFQQSWENGVSSGTNTNNTTTFIGTKIQASTLGSVYYNGKLSEAIIFSYPLTDNNRQKLERNQGKRYSISVS